MQGPGVFLADNRGFPPPPIVTSAAPQDGDNRGVTSWREAAIAEAERIPWEREFLPAIAKSTGQDGPLQRIPEWFILRIATVGEPHLLRLLRLIGLPYHVFTFSIQRSRRRAVSRHWFPGGYIFCHFDVYLDRWQQVLRMPYALEFLGNGRAPTPLPGAGDFSMDDLRSRLPTHLAKNRADAVIAVGTEIVITGGAFEKHTGTVIRSDPKVVVTMLFVFGALREVEVSVRDIRVVRAKAA